jgi:hypothetical protein
MKKNVVRITVAFLRSCGSCKLEGGNSDIRFYRANEKLYGTFSNL